MPEILLDINDFNKELTELIQTVEDRNQINKCLAASTQIQNCCSTALKGDITDADLIETLLDARQELLDHSPDREKGSELKEQYLQGLDQVKRMLGDIACFYLSNDGVKDSDLRALVQYSLIFTIAGGHWFSELMSTGFELEKRLVDLIKEKSHE